MRVIPMISMLALAGCAGWAPPVAALAAVEVASVVVFGRGVVDLAVSAASGQDCSIVRLDRRQTYCAPPEVARPEPFCTRSLGVVDCWADASLLPGPRRGVADGPAATAAQLRYRAAPWPKSLTGL